MPKYRVDYAVKLMNIVEAEDEEDALDKSWDQVKTEPVLMNLRRVDDVYTEVVG